MAVTKNEILKGKECPIEYQDNLDRLVRALNDFAEVIDTYYGKHIPLIVNSGLRAKNDQIRIYREKGITDISKIPMGSAHISAEAVDLRDTDHKIMTFIKSTNVLNDLDLYAEDFRHTPTWVHLQIRPVNQVNEFLYHRRKI